MREAFLRRWWIYQKERFPIVAHGLLIAAFSFSAVSFSSLLRGSFHLPDGRVVLVAFLSSFLAFLQLRIADEFKDFEEDSKFRPYRPVPRGLITLHELGWLWIITGIIQAMLALWLDARLLLLLLVNWTYLGLMSREFFAREWLKRRPVTYLWTHMIIMPLIDFYATACDWLPATGSPAHGLFWFVIVSFFNGVVIEIGRKIRAPEKEEVGVPTYSALWGGPKAAAVWLTLLAITALSAIYASGLVHFQRPVAITLFTMLGIATVLAICFSRTRAVGYGRWFENLSGIWTLLLYLALGAIPLLVKLGASG